MATEIERGTKTQEDQWRVESQVFQIYNLFQGIPPNSQLAILELQRDKHIEYLTKGLKHLSRSFTVLDANRPWLCYWMLHSIALLRDCVDDKLENDCIDFLSRCQDPKGGYGGGPGQMPHLATTYAAVNSLITLGGHRSLSSINRRTLYDFLLRMKDRSGGFRMHDGGEVDVRACYTAISVASVLNILDDELTQNVGDYISSCQTYEGGIAGEPGSEAHGGYTFCGLAAMILINEVNRLDLPALINWVVFRQGIECGFQGRTNKLVDGCYSFWQGGVAALIQRLHLIVTDQMGLSNILECKSSTDSDFDSINSDISADEQCLEGTPSHVNEAFQIQEEALIQRLHLIVTDQMGLSNILECKSSTDSDFDSINSDISADEQCLEGTSSHVNEGFQIQEEDISADEQCLEGTSSHVNEGFQIQEEALIQRLHLIVTDQMGLSNILECKSSTDSDFDSINSDISADEQCLEGTSSHVNEGFQIQEEAAGQPNSSHPADVNNVGYNFIKGHVHMKPLFNSMALQQYILLCSQEEGGFRDKPGKSRDHYHTCYCLSGLSVSQYSCTKDVGSPPLPQDVLGPYSNLLERVHPLYNVVLDRYYEANEFFRRNSL